MGPNRADATMHMGEDDLEPVPAPAADGGNRPLQPVRRVFRMLENTRAAGGSLGRQDPHAVHLENVPHWIRGKIEIGFPIQAGEQLRIPTEVQRPKSYVLLDSSGDAQATVVVFDGQVFIARSDASFEVLKGTVHLDGGFALEPSAEGFFIVHTHHEAADLVLLSPGTISFSPPPRFRGTGATIVPQNLETSAPEVLSRNRLLDFLRRFPS